MNLKLGNHFRHHWPLPKGLPDVGWVPLFSAIDPPSLAKCALTNGTLRASRRLVSRHLTPLGACSCDALPVWLGFVALRGLSWTSSRLSSSSAGALFLLRERCTRALHPCTQAIPQRNMQYVPLPFFRRIWEKSMSALQAENLASVSFAASCKPTSTRHSWTTTTRRLIFAIMLTGPLREYNDLGQANSYLYR